MAVIGMVLPGWAGHDPPARRLERILTESGHEVVSWVTSDLGEHIESGQRRRRGPVDSDSSAQLGPSARRSAGHAVAAGMAAATGRLAGPTIDRVNESGAELVVHDSMTPWGRVAARFLGLPCVCSLTHYPPPLLAPFSKPPQRYVEKYESERAALMERWGVDMGGPMETMFNFGDRTLAYTIPSIMGVPANAATWSFVGPLLEAEPVVPDESFANGDDRPLVYFSMGTSFNLDARLHRAVIEGLADIDARILVSTGGGIPLDELGTPPANVTVREWVPTRAVLPSVSVMVTHGGATTFHEALGAGVPLLVIPQAVDQPAWGQRVTDLGAGEMIEDPEPAPEAVRDAVTRLLGDPGPRARARELAEDLRSYDGAGIALEAVETLLA